MAVKYAPAPTARNRKEALKWAVKVAGAIQEVLESSPGEPRGRVGGTKLARPATSQPTVDDSGWCVIETGTCLVEMGAKGLKIVLKKRS